VGARDVPYEGGSFAAQSGVAGALAGTSTYDLAFNDVGDRDAGYYKYVYGHTNAFWDALNVNFHRWESYVSEVHEGAGEPVMAEYFFGHIGERREGGGRIGRRDAAGRSLRPAARSAKHDFARPRAAR